MLGGEIEGQGRRVFENNKRPGSSSVSQCVYVRTATRLRTATCFTAARVCSVKVTLFDGKNAGGEIGLLRKYARIASREQLAL